MDYRVFRTIREGSWNEHVRVARRAINQWIKNNHAGDDLLGDRADFNATVTCYAKGFQARQVDPSGIALAIDGVIGTNTWFALGDYSEEIGNGVDRGFG